MGAPANVGSNQFWDAHKTWIFWSNFSAFSAEAGQDEFCLSNDDALDCIFGAWWMPRCWMSIFLWMGVALSQSYCMLIHVIPSPVEAVLFQHIPELQIYKGYSIDIP